ncbi:glycosyltransferase [Luteolibacter arcticus]|uniref:Glycosyltransferase n=1 Tax=Luteolibacter arcticus TaxID=1581411 RepID=A0ABT3GJ85_9BACT|nr:glycosyltransferase [Luteolibacter arcticus]MCW1923552.1 glycosyltransferase [Luteolibacter arcticus]
MRWFTCTPMDFGGGPDFFARDSGLLCRGFQEAGVESRAIMPGASRPDDEPDLIRTGYADLESPAWWRGHELDGVVLYAWGRAKFRKVAEAIREAGIFLVLNQDSGGLVSPRLDPAAWWREQLVVSGAGRTPGGWWRFSKRAARGLTIGLALSDPLRAAHLRAGNVIACVTPVAADHYRHFCRIYGGEDFAARVRVVPHPVNPLFRFDGSPKTRSLAVIGRWDDATQKRPELMMEAVTNLLDSDFEVTVDIVGHATAELRKWAEKRDRVRLHGRIAPEAIAEILSRAQVAWCPSAFESFHIASGEALCCGCSVVAAVSPSLAAFPWFVSEASGTLAATDDLAGHVAAIRSELSAWDHGRRDGAAISGTWQSRLHAPEVARLVISIAGER